MAHQKPALLPFSSPGNSWKEAPEGVWVWILLCWCHWCPQLLTDCCWQLQEANKSCDIPWGLWGTCTANKTSGHLSGFLPLPRMLWIVHKGIFLHPIIMLYPLGFRRKSLLWSDLGKVHHLLWKECFIPSHSSKLFIFLEITHFNPGWAVSE